MTVADLGHVTIGLALDMITEQRKDVSHIDTGNTWNDTVRDATQADFDTFGR